ncbi:regulator of chromosome condensation 1/beta-lactamase-inhibitor protein II [Clohesyomyces aquaticus]|uniref:Regulator of chromosome condensation 1/beta-lactamase-inhibitor protein II n=1 Tax=Clohesyomyces aquaticus TaxID=1231657 RepID=A0A1Y1YDM9_9PLEO|nr:regulator of chromosome condensation 1/beta-lactamase-inhibitor protein II [Clohesyomyces aquaticus]
MTTGSSGPQGHRACLRPGQSRRVMTSRCFGLAVSGKILSTSPIGTLLVHFGHKGELTDDQLENLKKRDHGEAPRYFGIPLTTGLTGVIKSEAPGIVTFYTTKVERENRDVAVEIETIPQSSAEYRARMVAVANSSRVAVVMSPKTGATGLHARRGCILTFETVEKFKFWLMDGQPRIVHRGQYCSEEATRARWKMLVAGATTFTALRADGQVFTWTPDPRYPRCLGRPITDDESSDKPFPVPFLLHTKIKRIASGGYMTAAISADGELFLWGQACPGQERELLVLQARQEDMEIRRPTHDLSVNEPRGDVTGEVPQALFVPDPRTDTYLPPLPAKYGPWSAEKEMDWAVEVAVNRRDGIMNPHPNDLRARQATPSEPEDEYVHVVPVKIDGIEARVTHVAVGMGHILIAAETKFEWAVFSMGEGKEGQLGLGVPGVGGKPPAFMDTLQEVEALRGRKVTSLHCAGWSSWVVVVKKGHKEEEENVKIEPFKQYPEDVDDDEGEDE